VRYLSKNEATALRSALDARELKIKQARDSANRWREKRNYDTFPCLSDQTFADHLKPMVLISLNTGIRRGALLQLTWHDICFSKAILTIPGNISKSNKTRHIPLNQEALSTLQAWYEQSKHLRITSF
jgi:integrase